MARGTEENGIPLRAAAMRVRRRVRRVIVRTQVGFHFDDSPYQELPPSCPSDENLAEEKRRDLLRRSFKKAAREQAAGGL